MREDIKQFVKNWLLPPGLLGLISLKKGVRWSGTYASWEEALRVSTGYDSKVILDKVKDALLRVKNGEAVYERDSVLFDEIQYSWALLACLMWIAAQQRGYLNILDFGGSLGSTYFQNRKFLKALSGVQWNIVEQSHFVDVGKRHFEDSLLRFFYDIESCLNQVSPNTILFSSVIQYLEKPYELLKKVKGLKVKYILFDRTSLLIDGKDRLTVQTVPSQIYNADYPCWFFDKSRFYSFFEDDYQLIADYDALEGEMKLHNGQAAIYKGMLFVRKHRADNIDKSHELQIV